MKVLRYGRRHLVPNRFASQSVMGLRFLSSVDNGSDKRPKVGRRLSLNDLVSRGRKLLEITDLSTLSISDRKFREAALALRRQLGDVVDKVSPDVSRAKSFSVNLEAALRRISSESTQLAQAVQEIVNFLALAEEFSAPLTQSTADQYTAGSAPSSPQSPSPVRSLAGALTDDEFVWAILMLMRYEDALEPHDPLGSGPPCEQAALEEAASLLGCAAAPYGVGCVKEIHDVLQEIESESKSSNTRGPNNTASSIHHSQTAAAADAAARGDGGGERDFTKSSASANPRSEDRDVAALQRLLSSLSRPVDASSGTRTVNEDNCVRVLAFEFEATEFCPAYVLVVDDVRRRLVFSVRGTHSWKDLITDAMAMPVSGHNSADHTGLWHAGVARAANNTLKAARRRLRRACELAPADYELLFTGHSLGASVAALMALKWNSTEQGTRSARCVGFAPVAATNLTNAMSARVRDTVRLLVLDGDVVPRLHVASVIRLRAFSRRLVAHIPRMDHRYYYLVRPTLQSRVADQLAKVLGCEPELDPRLLSHEAHTAAFSYENLPVYFQPLYPPGVLVHFAGNRPPVRRTDPRFLDTLIISSRLLSYHSLITHARVLMAHTNPITL